MNQSDILIGEAVFYETGNHRWAPGLWDKLQSHKAEIEDRFKESLTYLKKFPNSPDAQNRQKALARVLDGVTQSHRSMDILMNRDAK